MTSQVVASNLNILQVTNKCEFFAPASYPALYLIGLRIPKIGRTSLHYQLGLFPLANPDQEFIGNMTHGYFCGEDNSKIEAFVKNASCLGDYVHVFVDPANDNRPAPVPEEWKPILQKLAA